jgi:gliding motility-associated lipoprotein GldH
MYCKRTGSIFQLYCDLIYFCSMRVKKNTFLFSLSFFLCLQSCNQVGIYEKNVSFKKQEWAAAEKPSFLFRITDTAAAYNIYIILRHTDAYSYNNIWMRFSRKGPNTSYSQQVDLRLANNSQGWLGTGMDDVWEQRIPITQGPAQFRKSGDYEFTLEQVMRQDPLQHVMNVGLRVEKVK